MARNNVRANGTAALLIGGYYADDSDPRLMSEVEIYGCPGAKRAPAPMVNRNYAMGAMFVDDGADGYILACGGNQCVDTHNGCIFGASQSCWTYNPAMDNAWIEMDDQMVEGRWGLLLGEMPHPDDAAVDVTLAVGFRTLTEYLDTDNGWVAHYELPNRWTNFNCMVQYDGLIYVIHDEVITWNPNDGVETTIVETPEDAIETSRCVVTTIDGQDGIFLRTGYFFDLATQSWVAPTGGSQIPTPAPTNEMFSYGGRPTVFGAPTCNGVNLCIFDSVIQYVWEDDEWVLLTEFLEYPRRYQEMVEVPIEFCNLIPESQSTSTPEPVTTSTTMSTEQGNAAIIVGGWTDPTVNPEIPYAVIEVFGCPTEKRIGQTELDFFLTGLAFVDDDKQDPYVLLCGGSECQKGSNTCYLSNSCFEYRPTDNKWREALPMSLTRASPLIAQVPLHLQEMMFCGLFHLPLVIV